MKQTNFTKEHYEQMIRDVKTYYSKDNIKKICDDRGDKYSSDEQTILHNVANDFLDSYICKRIKKYINYDYRMIISHLKTMRVDLNNVVEEKQRLAYQVRNVVLDQVILFVAGAFDGNKETK